MLKFKFLIIFLLLFRFAVSQEVLKKEKPILKFGRFNKDKINYILYRANTINDWSKKVEFLSSKFLDIPYKRIKLPFKTEKEIFIVQLDGVDCMTFVEYVEALAKSKNFEDFIKNLRDIRYKNGIVSYENRNHFFTDWIEWNGYKDIGKDIAPNKAIKVKKIINYSKFKRKHILKNIKPTLREFYYIKSKDFDKSIISKLKTGDIVGAYAYKKSLDWLDITHMGILIRKNGKVYFRNASSLKSYKKVVDIPLESYLDRVKGLVILRKVDKFK